MSSAPLAKFSATAVAESPDWAGPQSATVVLRHGELAFEAGETRLSIPLQSIFDINTGSIPPMFDSLPGVGVTIAYDRGDSNFDTDSAAAGQYGDDIGVNQNTGLTPATVNKALARLEQLGIVKELTAQKRNRLFSYTGYIEIMSRGTELPDR